MWESCFLVASWLGALFRTCLDLAPLVGCLHSGECLLIQDQKFNTRNVYLSNNIAAGCQHSQFSVEAMRHVRGSASQGIFVAGLFIDGTIDTLQSTYSRQVN